MTTTPDQFRESWEHWHSAREAALSEPDGWLGLTALHWLDDQPTALDGVPGLWHVDGDTVVHSGTPETGILTPAEGAPGVRVALGERSAEVIRRTGRYAVRIHDPKAPALASFAGIPVYEPEPAWVVSGRFTAFPERRIVVTGAVVDGLEHRHPAVGTVTFEHGGTEHTVTVFGDGSGPTRLLFTDATSGVTTYPAARILHIAAPAADGTVTLDLTRAENLPCAFTDAATCPIAPAENRLPFAVEAGERNPRLPGGAVRQGSTETQEVSA
ncbi:DUF1684 domain-containing protein [Rhodococcus sp. NPDC003318]|uniref:DUF1684 domain-containing protein n=1 Tax=Rhodococcus sp. NPDC003318 TaxID=3364503 RepID=UPI003682F290